MMSGEGSFLVLGLDGTVISSGGDLQGDERFVLLLFKVLGIFFMGQLYAVCTFATIALCQVCSNNLPTGQDSKPGRL